MDTTGWSEGYTTDDVYTYGFYPELAPEHLSYACVLNGVEPVALDRPFTYFELGFGQGLTVNVLAASNPHARFYANDFMPAHVVAAEQLAASAQLDNLTLLENSFAELAEGKVDLPQLDFITMHGIYSWVTAENRRHIVNFIARYLKPGGIVYVSYNALPGWAPALPMQRLISSQAKLHAGGSHQQLEHARQLISGLFDAKAEYFSDNPDLQRRVNSLRNDSPAYLTHEYLNGNWEPRYHADVAAELTMAKLDYAGPAILHFIGATLEPAQQALVDAVPDRALRETVRDFMMNTSFRKDVFVRGGRPMSNRRKREWLQRCTLALTAPREAASRSLDRFDTQSRAPIDELIDLLAKAPRKLDELARLPLFGGDIEIAASFCSIYLLESNSASIFFEDSRIQGGEPARRLNHALARDSRFEDRYRVLASPLISNGIKTTLLERLVYLQLAERPADTDTGAIASYVWQCMKDQLAEASRDEPAQSAAIKIADIAAKVENVLQTRLPMWRQLGML